MLVNIKVVRGEELSVDVLESATVADLKEEISKKLALPVTQIKLLKPSGGVLLSTTPVVDIYTHPNSLKVILGVDPDAISIKTKLLNGSLENSLTFPSSTKLSDFKEKVSELHGLTKSSLSFLHNGLVLTKDDLTLKELKIRNGALIILKQKKIVKLVSLNFCVPNSVNFQLSFPPSTPLSEIRNAIASKLQKNIDDVILIKSGISLADDNKILTDYNIVDGDTIQVQSKSTSTNRNAVVPANSLSDGMPCEKEKSAEDLQHPFFEEMDRVLTKHIPEERDRVRVMEHFSQHTAAYVNSLNLEDIEEMTPPSNH